MEEQISEVLDNVLGLLLLEGSYEIDETPEQWSVSIETEDAGRLIGSGGQSLEALQLLINQIVSQKQKEASPEGGFKRVILDVSGWRKQKEEDLKREAEAWGKQVLETGVEFALEPQSPWQRRIIHMAIEGIDGVETESVGEGRDRHIVIRPVAKVLKAKKSTKTKKESIKSDKSEKA